MTSRREILKSGLGLACIIAAGKAPAAIVKSLVGGNGMNYVESAGGKLPYAYEIEYIQSTGTQYIDLGFKGHSDFTCDVHIYRETNVPRFHFGANTSNSGGLSNCVGGILESKGWIYLYVALSGTWSGLVLVPADGKNYVGDIYLICKAGRRTVSNPTTGRSASKNIWDSGITTGAFTTDYNMSLFTPNAKPPSNTQTAGIRLYSADISSGGKSVSLIPVVDHDGIACLYDKVSRRNFYNNGTGGFIAGPVKE